MRIYRVRSSETWARAAAVYRAGRTAEWVCARYSLGVSAFRRRARVEGWRRCDFDAEDPSGQALEALAPMPSATVMADRIWRRVADAIDAGDPLAAARWTRLGERWAAQVRMEGGHTNRFLDPRFDEPEEMREHIAERVAVARTPAVEPAPPTLAAPPVAVAPAEPGAIARTRAFHPPAPEPSPAKAEAPPEPSAEMNEMHYATDQERSWLANYETRLAYALRMGNLCEENHWRPKIEKLKAEWRRRRDEAAAAPPALAA